MNASEKNPKSPTKKSELSNLYPYSYIACGFDEQSNECGQKIRQTDRINGNRLFQRIEQTLRLAERHDSMRTFVVGNGIEKGLVRRIEAMIESGCHPSEQSAGHKDEAKRDYRLAT